MHSSVVNAPIKLLLSQGNKINCLRGWGGGLPENVEFYRCAGTGIRFFRINFCLGFREVTFVTHKVFGDFLK